MTLALMAAGLALLVILISYVCFRFAFYVPPRKERDPDFIDLPPGPVYEPFHEQMTAWVLENRKLLKTVKEELAAEGFDDVLILYSIGNFMTDTNLPRLR